MPDRNFVFRERDYIQLRDDLFHLKRENASLKNRLTAYGMRRHQGVYMPSAASKWGKYFAGTDSGIVSGEAIEWDTFREDGTGNFVEDTTGVSTFMQLPSTGVYRSYWTVSGAKAVEGAGGANYDDVRLGATVDVVSGTTFTSETALAVWFTTFLEQEVAITGSEILRVTGTPPKVELKLFVTALNTAESGPFTVTFRNAMWCIEKIS